MCATLLLAGVARILAYFLCTSCTGAVLIQYRLMSHYIEILFGGCLNFVTIFMLQFPTLCKDVKI